MPERSVDHPFRDDCPSEYRLFRRRLILGTGAATALAALPGAVVAVVDGAGGSEAGKFMELSALLIDHRLDRDIGARLAAAMSHANAGIEQDIDALLDIAKKKNARIVEDFFPDVPEGRLRDTALAIISAWYSGVVSETQGSEVFAFELALMYQPTRDVMTIPSYAISGPNGWNPSAPPLSDMPEF